ncbi:FHA domain-containing protein, partial [Sulfitobacter sediminilitoris]|uniref:FHA domain-containing protein n=1 Tax=Sulfitobacter sediminilitoris TaxID=2698830 RepID=UPI00361930A3
CVIEDHNGNVVVVDLSTNGTFLNYSKTPLGRTPTPLNNGDILSVGPYELMVEIADASPPSIPDPVSNDPVSRGQAGNSPNPMQLLDDVGPGGDFLEDLLGSPEGPKAPVRSRPPIR